jgi:hypothetical protein
MRHWDSPPESQGRFLFCPPVKTATHSQSLMPGLHANELLEDDTLVGRPRIAKLLGVSAGTVALYVAEGRFPVTKIDGRSYARVSDVLRYRDRRAEEKRRRRQSA